MTQEDKARAYVERLLHDTHLRFQRQQLAPTSAKCYIAPRGDGVRGLRREPSASERRSREFKPEWFTHLRPNFWKAYFETLLYMTKT